MHFLKNSNYPSLATSKSSNNCSYSESCDSSDSSKQASDPNEALSLDSDTAKSPVNIYSTSPSSFSCSSSSSSLLSLSHMGLAGGCKEEADNCDLDESMSNCDSDKYKPEDVKRWVSLYQRDPLKWLYYSLVLFFCNVFKFIIIRCYSKM